jgi:hypothetical protein
VPLRSNRSRYHPSSDEELPANISATVACVLRRFGAMITLFRNVQLILPRLLTRVQIQFAQANRLRPNISGRSWTIYDFFWVSDPYRLLVFRYGLHRSHVGVAS